MTEQHSDDLRALIERAFDAEEARTAAPEPPRDEGGKFAPREAPAETSEQPEAPAEAPQEDDYDEAVGLDRDTWKLTPAQARERAKALAKEAREASERAKAYEPLDRVIAPRRDALRATFGGEDRALEQLFHLSDWAGRDPAGFLRHFAQERGVDLRGLVPQQAEPGAQQPQPPDVDRLIEQRVERVLAERETARALQEFERNDAYEFRTDPDVRRVMAGLLQSGAASDLPSAYSMAVKAHPTISAKLAERESAERAKREAEDRARRAAEKASAAVSVKGAPGTATPAAPTIPQSVRAAVERAFEIEAGRV